MECLSVSVSLHLPSLRWRHRFWEESVHTLDGKCVQPPSRLLPAPSSEVLPHCNMKPPDPSTRGLQEPLKEARAHSKIAKDLLGKVDSETFSYFPSSLCTAPTPPSFSSWTHGVLRLTYFYPLYLKGFLLQIWMRQPPSHQADHTSFQSSHPSTSFYPIILFKFFHSMDPYPEVYIGWFANLCLHKHISFPLLNEFHKWRTLQILFTTVPQ